MSELTMEQITVSFNEIRDNLIRESKMFNNTLFAGSGISPRIGCIKTISLPFNIKFGSREEGMGSISCCIPNHKGDSKDFKQQMLIMLLGILPTPNKKWKQKYELMRPGITIVVYVLEKKNQEAELYVHLYFKDEEEREEEDESDDENPSD